MTQIAPTSYKISESLDPKLVQNGGCTIANIPTLSCSMPTEHETMKVEFGGYKAIINYNKHREKQHKTDKFNQKMRALNRNIKNKRLRQRGLTINTGVEGGTKS